jgi:glycyl-tRNA synthetase
MQNEMAHYAADCWDAEIQSSYGWIECVGCADRSAYDLTVHSKKTGQPLVARVTLPEPIIEEKEVVEFNNKNLGKAFGKENPVVQSILNKASEKELTEIKEALKNGCAKPFRLPFHIHTSHQ